MHGNRQKRHNMNTNKSYEEIISSGAISVITSCRDLLDCSVDGYNFSCCYNPESNKHSVVIDHNGDFVFCNKTESKDLFNLLKMRVRNG